MEGLRIVSACFVLFVGGAAATNSRSQVEPPSSPEARAVRYLTAEVPRWRREHPCYSCHNNGDAARALVAARRGGYSLDGALDDTLSWLEHPEEWAATATEGGFSDKALARIQFSAALAAAADAGMVPRQALNAAAEIIAADQRPDGSWRFDSSQSAGTPATYGTALATWSARRTLRQAGVPALVPAIERADTWLRNFDPLNVLDAAAIALALADAADQAGRDSRSRALSLLASGQGPDGGWGLYPTSASEPFDTAVAMLALLAQNSPNEHLRAIEAGRRSLVERQLPDGSWPETTRPAGQESYAQRISTTGWATLALLASSESAETVR